MKIRIASSLALAAALALGLSGCNLIAPQATTIPYAPSDGVDVTVDGVDVRNLILIADESGKNFNVVFSSVNMTGKERDLTVSFSGSGTGEAAAEFKIPTGNTRFGNPEGEQKPVLVTIDDLAPGDTVKAFLQSGKSSEEEVFVPVLDGELEEYADYVLPADFATKLSASTKSGSTDNETAKDNNASEDANE